MFPKKMSFFLDCLTVIQVAPSLVAGGPRCSLAYHWRSLACCQHSQTYCRHSQTCPQHSQVLPGAPNVLSCAPTCTQTYQNHFYDPAVSVNSNPCYSKGQPEFPPKVWYSPEIEASKFTPHILSDTAEGFQYLQYILLMYRPFDACYHQYIRSNQD